MDSSGTTPTSEIQETQKTEQVCTIQIACIVSSDDEAMGLKQRITEAVKAIPKKRVAFNLSEGTLPFNPSTR